MVEAGNESDHDTEMLVNNKERTSFCASASSSGEENCDRKRESREEREEDHECKARAAHISKTHTEAEILQKTLGMTKEEKNRSRALSRLGITEEDLNAAERIFIEAAALCGLSGRKEERILGYSVEQMKREKALDRLGVTEEELELQRSKSLASLGYSDARRGSAASALAAGKYFRFSMYLLSSSHSRSNIPSLRTFSSSSSMLGGGADTGVEQDKRKSIADITTAAKEAWEGLTSALSYSELYTLYMNEKRRSDRLEMQLERYLQGIGPGSGEETHRSEVQIDYRDGLLKRGSRRGSC